MSTDDGTLAAIVASNSRPPAIAASRVTVVIRSMLTPWRLSVDDTSWTMPG